MKITQPDGTPVKSLIDAQASLRAAINRYEDAKSKCDQARRDETQALNDLNTAQKVFDNAANAERADAPSASLWKAEQRKGIAA